MNYSFGITIKKGIKYIVLFAIPFIVAQFIALFPQLADLTLIDMLKALVPEAYLKLTVGAVLVMAVNWLKNYVGVRLP